MVILLIMALSGGSYSYYSHSQLIKISKTDQDIKSEKDINETDITKPVLNPKTGEPVFGKDGKPLVETYKHKGTKVANEKHKTTDDELKKEEDKEKIKTISSTFALGPGVVGGTSINAVDVVFQQKLVSFLGTDLGLGVNAYSKVDFSQAGGFVNLVLFR
jgi:hypothetical protein